MATQYEAVNQDLPAYSQEGERYPLQTRSPGNAGRYSSLTQTNGQRPEHQRNVRDEERDDPFDKDIMGPGDIPDEALDLEFGKCFYEHKSTKTFPELTSCLGFTYKHIKMILYTILVLILGIPLTILFALFNAIAVFIMVWFYQPLLRVFVMWIYALTPAATAPYQALMTPIVDVSARIFRQIRIKVNMEGSFAERLAERNLMQPV